MINRFTAMQERHPQLQPHYIRQRQPVTRQGGVFAKFMDIVRSAQLNAVIVATHGNNLVLLHRKRTGLEHLKVPEFSLAYTVIPRRVVKLEESAFPGWEGVRQIQLAPTSITFLTVANDGLANALQQLL
jgi:hypothetical protein